MSEKDINNLKEMLVDFNEYSTDYTKTRCRELEETMENTLKEIERLHSIINELFEYLKDNSEQPDLFESDRYYEDILDKLQELLGSDKE